MTATATITTPVPTRTGVTRAIFEDEIVPAGQPVIMKGLVAQWPVAEAAATSREALAEYLKARATDAAVDTFAGNPPMDGRYFYTEALDGYNFEKGATTLHRTIDELLKMADRTPHVMIYAGSTPTSVAMPGFIEENAMPLLDPSVEPRLWLGNRSRVAAHYDNSRNIACCVAGPRRFTVFPPDQIGNLYLGPLDFTMAGPPASMVDFNNVDRQRFPRFSAAEQAGQIAELEPGDAVYLPPLWWHHVTADGPFNLLVNYWWMPPNAGSAFDAVLLAMMDVRDQPQPEKEAWRAYFEHFVFGDNAAHVADHLPERWQQLTGPKTRERDARLTQFVISQLQRRIT